jgi:phage gpG-like protein
MSRLFSLLEAAHHFSSLAHGLPQAQHAALEIAARIVEADAKRAIGTYRYRWRQLAPSTLARKAANTPLLETGEMRDSISHWSSPTMAVVGSTDLKAVWHELGTRSIPPRPFLSEALRRNEKLVVRAVGQTIRDFLAAERMHADVLKLLIEAAHKIIHSLAELVPEDEDRERRR